MRPLANCLSILAALAALASLHAADFNLAAQATTSQVFHKAFIAVDENGTEAAAATAVAMEVASAMRKTPPPPIPVKVDRPFLYAIQHVPSGACLFIGRVTDPR